MNSTSPFIISSECEKFRAYYNLKNENPNSFDLMVSLMVFVWQILQESNEVKELLKDREDEDLFFSLLIRFFIIETLNGHKLLNPLDLHPKSSSTVGKETEIFGSGVSLIYSFFNHSCAPNTTQIPGNNLTYVLRPIKAGEQLFTSYG